MAKAQNMLVLWGHSSERQTVYRILAATGANVRYVEEWDPSYVEEGQLIVIDFDSHRERALKVLESLSAQPKKANVLVVADTNDRSRIIELLNYSAWTSILANNSRVDSTELIVTVQKIVRGEIFGLEKYLTWGVTPQKLTIRSSNEKNAAIDKMSEYLHGIGCNKRIIDVAKSAADEFIMNAVYDAPLDTDGTPKYAHLPRTVAVDLAPTEYATFQWMCDGRLLGIAISDQFGCLQDSTVRSYLRKSFSGGEDQLDNKPGGAGIGLYQIYESLNWFVINVAPGKKTEMIGIIDVSGSYKGFREKAKSLHIFFGDCM